MTQVYETERALQHDIERRVAAGAPGVEVLAVELSGPERFCVYIDRDSGVDHALCEQVTGLLRDYLARYSVDVSSPGFERPLRTQSHFAAVAGSLVSIRTGYEIDGRRRFRGTVGEAGPDAVTIELDGHEVEIPYDAIVRANLINEGR